MATGRILEQSCQPGGAHPAAFGQELPVARPAYLVLLWQLSSRSIRCRAALQLAAYNRDTMRMINYHGLRHSATAVCLLVGLQFAAASATAAVKPPEVARMVSEERWKDAARAMYLQAVELDPNESDLPSSQAKAGFFDDALDTVLRRYPNYRSHGYLDIVRNLPKQHREKETTLLELAANAARADAPGNLPTFRSGALTVLALHHEQQGRSDIAAALYAEALDAASFGLNEKDHDGYRNISEVLRRAEPGTVSNVMFIRLLTLLKNDRDPRTRTLVCIDLAWAAAQQGQRELVKDFVDCSIEAAASLNRRGQSSALEKLGILAIKVGLPVKGLDASAKVRALRDARAGNVEQAYALAAGQGENLYVDFAEDLYKAVIDDALTRGDIVTALYFAQRPLKPISWINAAIWQKIAEKQAEFGHKQQAHDSFRKAAAILIDDASYERYADHVKRALDLGASMRRHDLESEGKQILLQVPPMLVKISPRRVDDRIEAAVATAQALWRAGMASTAKQLLADAYRDASAYDESRIAGRHSKARHLRTTGDTAALFAAFPIPVEQRRSKSGRQ